MMRHPLLATALLLASTLWAPGAAAHTCEGAATDAEEAIQDQQTYVENVVTECGTVGCPTPFVQRIGDMGAFDWARACLP